MNNKTKYKYHSYLIIKQNISTTVIIKYLRYLKKEKKKPFHTLSVRQVSLIWASPAIRTGLIISLIFSLTGVNRGTLTLFPVCTFKQFMSAAWPFTSLFKSIQVCKKKKKKAFNLMFYIIYEINRTFNKTMVY